MHFCRCVQMMQSTLCKYVKVAPITHTRSHANFRRHLIIWRQQRRFRRTQTPLLMSNRQHMWNAFESSKTGRKDGWSAHKSVKYHLFFLLPLTVTPCQNHVREAHRLVLQTHLKRHKQPHLTATQDSVWLIHKTTEKYSNMYPGAVCSALSSVFKVEKGDASEARRSLVPEELLKGEFGWTFLWQLQ